MLGAASENARANEAQKLLNWGYTAFEAIKLFDANQAVVTPEVWKGTEKTAKLGRPQAVVVAVPAGTAGRIKTQVARPDPLIAPLTKGQAVGTLKISVGRPAAAGRAAGRPGNGGAGRRVQPGLGRRAALDQVARA